MKKWMLLGFLVLGAAGRACAQEIAAPGAASGSSAGNFGQTMRAIVLPNSSHDFLSGSVRSTSSLGFAGPKFAVPIASAALAEPAPQVISRGNENDRWQLGLGFTYLKFRSPAIHADMLGLNTSVTYFTNDWFGVEGNITAAFGQKIFVGERTKYGGFTGGPKIVMRRRGWEPWAHALLGIAHVNPQLAGISKNGVAMQVGGGADYPLWEQFSVRVEGDWVPTLLYKSWQSNFQVATGFFLHF